METYLITKASDERRYYILEGMTKQQMRDQIRRTRKRLKKQEEEDVLLSNVKEKMKQTLDDPYRRHWNKYHCWNFRTIEGIEKDCKDGWEFEVRDGIIFAINNPKLDELHSGIDKISMEEYQAMISEGAEGLSTVDEDSSDGKE